VRQGQSRREREREGGEKRRAELNDEERVRRAAHLGRSGDASREVEAADGGCDAMRRARRPIPPRVPGQWGSSQPPPASDSAYPPTQ
jgi:hypothetical protein